MKRIILLTLSALLALAGNSARAQSSRFTVQAGYVYPLQEKYSTDIFECSLTYMGALGRQFWVGFGAGVDHAMPLVITTDSPHAIPYHEKVGGFSFPVFAKLKADFSPFPSHLFLALKAGTRIGNYRYDERLFGFTFQDTIYPFLFFVTPSLGYEFGRFGLEAGVDVNLTQHLSVESTEGIPDTVTLEEVRVYSRHGAVSHFWPGLYAALTFSF